MRQAAAFVGSLLVSAGALAAPVDPFSSMHGRAILMTDQNGGQSTLNVGSDLTWQIRSADGSLSSGTYRAEGEKTLCFTTIVPVPRPPAKATECMLYTGDRRHQRVFTLIDANGRPIYLSVRLPR